MAFDLSVVGPIVALSSLLAGVVGAFVGVKFTAGSARETATQTALIVQGLATSVAVLQVQVGYLSEGLKSATADLDRLRDTMRDTLQ